MKVTRTRWMQRLAFVGALGVASSAGAQAQAPQDAPAEAAPVNADDPAQPAPPSTPDPELPEQPAPGLQDAKPEGTGSSGPMGFVNPLLNNVTDFVQSGKPKAFPLRMMVLFDTSVGAGNFMLNKYARQPYVANTIRLQPSLTIWKSLRATARIDITKEWIASSTQTTTVPNQIVLGDLWMGLSMPNIYTESFTGIGFGAGVWTFAPTSVQSRADTLITAVRPWAMVNWYKWGFNLNYNFSIRKNFHEYANPTVDSRASFNQECPLEGRCMWAPSIDTGAAVRSTDLIKVPGNRTLDMRRRNVSHTFIHIMSASYTVFDVLTPSATMMVTSNFRYPLEPGEFSSPYARGNAWGHTDALWGVLDLTYAPFKHVAFSTGVFTVQPFFADHRGSGLPGWSNTIQSKDTTGGKLYPNFPFFDFFTPGNNYSSFYFDVIVSI